MSESNVNAVAYTPDRALTGGIRTVAHKLRSTHGPIRAGPMPSRLVLALSQHRGPPALPVVGVGERVLKYQALAAADGPLSAAVHAPTSGRVTAIEDRRVPLGHALQSSACIVIEPDGRDEAVQAAPPAWPDEPDARLERIRAAGLVGLGGAVYPTAAKLGSGAPCRLLIINGAECEPFISCDDMLMRESPDGIVEGARLMADLLGAPRCIIAIERDKPKAIDAIGTAIRSAGDSRLKLAELPTIYPAGGERQLIEILTGDEVTAGGFPTDSGYVCHNVGTCRALQQLARHGLPLISRVVTVTGDGIREPGNVETLIGTPLDELIEHCGGYVDGVCRLILGGSMMGYALPSDALPITKASNCIIAATPREIRTDPKEWPCIRCGECSIACPARLQPQELLRAARTASFDQLAALGLRDCIECGCCDVVCPSHIPLTEAFRQAKRDHARHEARARRSADAEQHYRERMRRQQAETAASDQRRAELIGTVQKDPAQAADEIRAAVERARARRQQRRDP